MTANPSALQLYTLREQLTADRPGVLAQVAALGYGAVEPFNILSDPDGLRADLDAAGLFACSVHAVPAGEHAEDVVRAAKPKWAEVKGEFRPRGGIGTVVTACYPRPKS